MEYKELDLGSLITLNYGKSLPKVKRIEGKYPVYGSGGITGYHSEYLIEGPGVIVGRKGTVGSLFFEKGNYFPIDTTYYIKPSEKYDLKYVYYLLDTLGLSSMNTHSAVPGLNRDGVYSKRIKLPSIEYQRKISSFLSLFEEKIELNNQMIATLEELAATLFKRWFVDFEFPDENGNPYKSSGGKMVDSELGEIPEGWEVKSLGEVCLKNKNNVSVDLLHLEDYISTENLLTDKKGIKVAAKKPSVKRVKQFIEGDILISNIRPYFKKIWFANSQGGYSSDVLNFRANKDKISSEYLFFYLYQDEFFNFMTITSKGTKMPRGDKAAIKGKKLIIPSNNVLSSYTSIVRAYVHQIGELRSENRALGGLRELLLPKLLSGEIILSK